MFRTLLLVICLASALWSSDAGSALADGSTTIAADVGARAWPPAHPPSSMSLHALLTGQTFARAAMAYSGGALGEKRVFSQGAILIRHPAGNLLIDSGFGKDAEAHFRTTPWLMQQFSGIRRLTPVSAQLRAAGIDPRMLFGVVLTHAHWDHVSGLADLPGVPVYTNQSELAFIRSGDESASLAQQLGLESYRVYPFEGGPYLGFSQSHDMFDDGSVVLVPAPGHTPGSIVIFVNTPDARHYALIGDLVWQLEGIDQVLPKPWFVRRRVDADADATLAMIERLHALKVSLPTLVVVPAHDARVWQTLPKLVAPSVATPTDSKSRD